MNRSQPSQPRVGPIRGSAFSGLRRVHEIAHRVVDSFKSQDTSSTSKIRQLGISAPIQTMQPVQPRFQPPTGVRPVPPPSSTPFAQQTAVPSRLPPPTQAHALNRSQPPVAFNKGQPASHGFNRPLSTATSMTGTTISFASAPMSDSSTIGSPPPLPAPRVDSKQSWDDSFMTGLRASEAPKPAQPEVWRFDERGLRPLHFPLQRRPTDPYSRGIDAAVASTSKQPAPSILPPMTRPRAVTGASRPTPHPIPIEPRRKLSSFTESSVSSAEIHLAERVPVGRLAPGPAPRVFRTAKGENTVVMQPIPPRAEGMRVAWEQPMGPGTGPARTIQRSASARQPGAIATGQPPRRVLQNWNQVPMQPGPQHKPPTFTHHRRAGTIDVVPGVRRVPMPQPLYEVWHEPQPMATVNSYFPRAIQV